MALIKRLKLKKYHYHDFFGYNNNKSQPIDHELQVKEEKKSAPPRFILETLLGSGSLCEVYSALDLRRVEWGDANPKVAIKRIRISNPNNYYAELSLVQEFCVLRQLTHKGIVRVYDLHLEPFGVCFSMELLNGFTVYNLMQFYPHGIGDKWIIYARQLFESLLHSHEEGIFHGDIKPNNIFISTNDRLVIFDFNVSLINTKPGNTSITKTKKLNSSLTINSCNILYSGPERLTNMRPSMEDDIFSACCVIYEMISGKHPFHRCSSIEAYNLEIAPTQPIGTNKRQWNILRNGLSPYPDKRPNLNDLLNAFSCPKKISFFMSK